MSLPSITCCFPGTTSNLTGEINNGKISVQPPCYTTPANINGSIISLKLFYEKRSKNFESYSIFRCAWLWVRQGAEAPWWLLSLSSLSNLSFPHPFCLTISICYCIYFPCFRQIFTLSPSLFVVTLIIYAHLTQSSRRFTTYQKFSPFFNLCPSMNTYDLWFSCPNYYFPQFLEVPS